ncbi:hypothetical protein ACH5RR_008407 [Cinchona calisaya]|uniref:Isoleucine N-monooxygenase 2-like n=1 Tax=Cinchona calisaya TaxID=153742 RepID=A0ABD3ABA2_9GENT
MEFSSTPWILIFPGLMASVIATLVIRKLPTNPESNSFPLPPGPKPWPFIGCIYQVLRYKPTFRWIQKVMYEMNSEIACIRICGVHVIPVTSPELAREFLKKQDTIFSNRPICMSAEIVGGGYLTTVLAPLGDHYKKMKRIVVSSVLSTAKHHWLHNKRIEEADHIVSYVYNQCKDSANGDLVNLRIAARHYCGNVVRRMFFNKRFFGKGMEDGGPGAEEVEHIEALFTILEHLYSFSILDFVPWLRILDLDGHEKILRTAVASTQKYHDPEIEKRAQMWENGLKDEEDDLLDVLIRLKDGSGRPTLTTEEIKAQITELMLATVDNPSNAVEWAMAEMLNQPELLAKATEELDTIVGRHRLVQESDLPQLKYLKACIKEAFRLHPFAPFNVPHVSTQETIVADYFIPKGSHVILSRPGLGRNPRIWEDALKYKPERHLKDMDECKMDLNDLELNMFAFSTGRRGCPGVQLGSTLSVMLLARLLQCFTWKIPSGLSRICLIESGNGLTPATPLIAVAKPRLAISLAMKNV